ncbi:dihydrodipicolinate synthase family protein [Salibacterium aidingense]|uniref:dihydrodipicolinate synthase family protein n=1 Tax=Salibacterium aidingense TaxID=384933 RepID=UPI003BE65347
MGIKHLEGVISAIVTPLHSNGSEIDPQGMKRLINFLIDKGVHGLFPLGSTGEGILFDVATRKKVMDLVLSEVNGRVPVIFNVGALRQQDVLKLAQHSVEIEADGIAVIPPFYYGLDESALEKFFSTVAKTVDCPIYLYNIPSNTKNSISVSLFSKLAGRYPHIMGMKESSMNFADFYELVQAAESTHSTLMGNDAQFFPALAVGGSGAVSAGSTAMPEPYVALYNAYKEGNMEEARQWQEVCAEVKRMLLASFPAGGHKKALELRGIINGTVSAPLRQLSDHEIKELENSMEKLGFLGADRTPRKFI